MARARIGKFGDRAPACLPAAIVAGLATLLLPGPALSHGGTHAFVLLLPTHYYLAGGAIAVAATFLLLAFMPQRWTDAIGAARLRLAALRPPSPVPTSLLSALVLAALIAVGVTGSRDPLANPLPLLVWTVWWVGFTLLTAAVGNLWAYLNPWVGPYRLLARLLGRDGGAAPIAYPDRLGYWPAVAVFLGFAWFELIDLAPSDPERLAVVVAVYWAAVFLGVLLFGEVWLARAEPFSVFFRFIGRLSPLAWEDEADDGARRLAVAVPGAALLRGEALPVSGVLFVLLTLATVSFDGLDKTFWWLDLNGINPLAFPGRSAMVGTNSAGILLMWTALAGAYVGAVWLGWRLAGRPAPFGGLLGTLVFSIIPISLVYHFSHYLTALMVDGQYAVAALSDPFDTGLNLLGFARNEVTTSFLNTYEGARGIWNAQTVAIVSGHVLGILLAHLLAARRVADYRAAVVSQIPLALVMVAYTLVGLWLLSSPVAG
jgi:hypothetical protein